MAIYFNTKPSIYLIKYRFFESNTPMDSFHLSLSSHGPVLSNLLGLNEFIKQCIHPKSGKPRSAFARIPKALVTEETFQNFES